MGTGALDNGLPGAYIGRVTERASTSQPSQGTKGTAGMDLTISFDILPTLYILRYRDQQSAAHQYRIALAAQIRQLLAAFAHADHPSTQKEHRR